VKVEVVLYPEESRLREIADLSLPSDLIGSYCCYCFGEFNADCSSSLKAGILV
jgi:hypothetical protein